MLIVDEDEDLRELLAWRLARAGFVVVCEPDGERGLARALALRPEVAVIDGAEPVFGGLELCRRLRASPATARTRLLLVASPDHGVHEARSSGADIVVSKPFSSSDMVARVRALAETWSGGS